MLCEAFARIIAADLGRRYEWSWSRRCETRRLDFDRNLKSADSSIALISDEHISSDESDDEQDGLKLKPAPADVTSFIWVFRNLRHRPG